MSILITINLYHNLHYNIWNLTFLKSKKGFVVGHKKILVFNSLKVLRGKPLGKYTKNLPPPRERGF